MTVGVPPRSSVARARAVVRLNTAYFQTKVLQSAVELGVFDLLADGPATADTLQEKLAVRHRLTPDFLDALVGLELLERDGAEYRNSDLTAEFLVTGQPTYLGGTCAQHAKLHYHAWGRLTEALRDGHAKSAVAAQGSTAYPDYYRDLDKARQVMTHMDAHNGFTADELARRLDWSEYTTFTDVGGARGNVAARIARAHPHLRGSVVDLPALRPLCDELMRELGTADRVHFAGGDFFVDPLPASDVIVMGHVLADWPLEKRMRLLHSAYRAVSPGGRIAVYDVMIDPSRDDLETLLQRLNSAMIRDDNSAYSVSDCEGYLREAGFEVEQVFRADTITRDHVVVARKAA
ncbi:methyltransferase [Actinoplanes awajinensis]|uniref:methyltransferase n=1 Tax=Actinoplanes awajinensis TaxID=135946 RepID=UPI0008335B65|nr:methyltransferase [Actinoplanes awajinensis]